MWPISNKVAVIGIGESAYTRWGKAGRSELVLALEAVSKAVDDAGISMTEVDGFASYASERQEPITLANALGIEQLRFNGMHWGGGGGGAPGGAMMAMLAVATGTCKYAVAYRSLSQGQFYRFGQNQGGKTAGGGQQFTTPFGLMNPAQMFALQTRRHMYEYGTTSEQLGNISVASYKHAQNNPRAVMFGRPITLEDHQASRMIADPFHLYDCCQENDGACAIVLTSVENAQDCKQQPVYILSAAQGSGYLENVGSHNKRNYASANFQSVANDLYERGGVGPGDIDVAQIYENFTGMVLMSIEDHGFCKRGEGGPFVEGGRIEVGGDLPINTSGGNLAEAYIHGFELVIEGVRQMRGTSSNQVVDAELCLVAGGPGVAPCSNMILRR